MPQWITHPRILYQVCATRGATLLLLFMHSAKSSDAQKEHLPTSPTARDSADVARGRCYPHTGNGGHSRCLSSSLSLSVGYSIQDEAMGVARSAPQGAHYAHTCGSACAHSIVRLHNETHQLLLASTSSHVQL